MKKLICTKDKHEKNHQRFEFNYQIQNLKKHDVVINLDFKQNVKINEQSDVQINSEFYAPPQRSVFEIVLFFYNNETEQYQRCYFDFFFDCFKHDSLFVI